jgi:hypothetical protein
MGKQNACLYNRLEKSMIDATEIKADFMEPKEIQTVHNEG